jgi:cellulose synthase/poly-beta-1,6-N-acetylglucosamine synthase-like glycosyltransferase
MDLFTGAMVAADLFVGLVLVLLAGRRMLLTAVSFRRVEPGPAPVDLPRFWVVGALLNESARVPELVRSIGALEYPSVEVVLVDDASDDDTVVRLKKLAPPEWRIDVNQDGTRRGKAGALHASLSSLPIADDDLVLVTDADHVLPPDALSRLATWFGDPDVDAVAFGHRAIAPGRSLVSVFCELEGAVSEEVNSRGRAALWGDAALAGVFGCRWTAFRRFYPSDWNLADDATFSAALHAAGRRIGYATDISSRHEVPDTLRGYVHQHLRWIVGLYATGRSVSGNLLRTRDRTWSARLGSAVNSFGYAERPFFILWAILSACVLCMGHGGWLVTLPLFTFGAAVSGQLFAALLHIKAPGRLWLLAVPSLAMGAVDVALSTYGLFRRFGEGEGWSSKKFAERPRDAALPE